MILETYPTPAMGANTYVLASDAGDVLIVDPGDPDSPAFARAASLGTVRYVLLTHGHFDHVLGAKAACARTGAPLVIHEADAGMLSDPETGLFSRFGAEAPMLTPDRTVRDGDVLPLGDAGIEVIHTPGHTPGSVCFRVGERLFSGDTLFAGSVGRTDFPGGDTQMLFASLRRLAKLPSALTVLPGHGPATTLTTEQAGNPYMKRACYGTVCDR